MVKYQKPGGQNEEAKKIPKGVKGKSRIGGD